MRRGCSHFNSSGKGQGYFAERRIQNGIVLRRLENNAKLLSPPHLHFENNAIVRSAFCEILLRMVKVAKRAVLSPFKVVVTNQKCFHAIGHLFSSGGSLIETRYMVST